MKALFTNVTGSYASEGIAQRLDRYLTPWLSGDGTNAAIMTSRLDAAGSVISRLTDQMAALDSRLALHESSLRARFTALESALQQNQTQGQWLTAQLARL